MRGPSRPAIIGASAAQPIARHSKVLGGIVSADRAAREATVWGGATIQRRSARCAPRGSPWSAWGHRPPDDRAPCPSAHTGRAAGLGSISTQVAGLTLVTAADERVTCSATTEPALFESSRVSLGALGVMTRVRLRHLPWDRFQGCPPPARSPRPLPQRPPARDPRRLSTTPRSRHVASGPTSPCSTPPRHRRALTRAPVRSRSTPSIFPCRIGRIHRPGVCSRSRCTL
jgi:hypothetical protein